MAVQSADQTQLTGAGSPYQSGPKSTFGGREVVDISSRPNGPEAKAQDVADGIRSRSPSAGSEDDSKAKKTKPDGKTDFERRSEARTASIKEAVKNLHEAIDSSRGQEEFRPRVTNLLAELQTAKEPIKGQAHFKNDVEIDGDLSIKATTKGKFTQVANGDGTYKMVFTSVSSEGLTPGAIAAGILTSTPFIGAVADVVTHVPGPVGNAAGQMVSDAKSAAGGVIALAAGLTGLAKGFSAVAQAVSKEQQMQNETVTKKKEGLKVARDEKIMEAGSELLGAAKNGIKFIQYLADKALLHIKEFFLTILKYLVPTLTFLQGLIDIISGSMAAQRHALSRSEFATDEKNVSNACKIALAVVNIAVAIFTVIVAALALVLSPLVLPILYGIVGMLNLAKVAVDLHADNAQSQAYAKLANDYLLTNEVETRAYAWLRRFASASTSENEDDPVDELDAPSDGHVGGGQV